MYLYIKDSVVFVLIPKNKCYLGLSVHIIIDVGKNPTYYILVTPVVGQDRKEITTSNNGECHKRTLHFL